MQPAGAQPPTRWSRTAKALAAAGGLVAGLVAVITLLQQFDRWPFDADPVVIVSSVPAPESDSVRECPTVSVGKGDNPVSVDLWVRDPFSLCWVSGAETFLPGDTVEYMIGYRNASDETQSDLVVRVNPPPSMTPVPNSTWLANSNHPDGTLVATNAITESGIVIGSYGPEAGAWVKFELALPFEPDLACGTNEFRAVGVVRPEGHNEFYNTADANVRVYCQER